MFTRIPGLSAALLVTLVSANARAEADAETTWARQRVISQMAICDAVAKLPPLLMLGVFGGRAAVTALAGGSRPFIAAGSEERLFLAGIGTAAAGHSLCGPAIFAGHGAYGRATLSLGLRLGLPLSALAITFGLYRARVPRGEFGDGASDQVGAVIAGAAVLGGFAFDYAWAAGAGAPRAPRAPRPVVMPTAGGVMLGLGGTL